MAQQSQQQLPGFRLRQLSSPVSRQTLVTMRRRSYDDLIARNPDAMLGYLDEDDGEHVTVGTSFELLQRLSEPLDSSSGEQSHPAAHAFDVRDSDAARRDWQTYVDRSAAAVDTNTSNQLFSRVAGLSVVDASSPPSGSLTPAGKQQIKEAAAALQRASKNPSHLSDPQECSPHTTRWVSYGTLPTSFSSPSPHSTAPQPDEEPTPAPAPLPQGSSAKPLLALFEAELAKLTASPPTELVSQPPVEAAGSSTASTAAQTQPNYQSSQTQTATTNTTSRDVISNSMKTLSEGIGLLKSTTSDVNKELRQLASTVPKDLMELIRSRVQGSEEVVPQLNQQFVNHNQTRLHDHRKKINDLISSLTDYLDQDDPWAAMNGDRREEPEPTLPSSPRLSVTLPNNRTGDTEQCGNECLQGCTRTACPVRALVKGAHSLLAPQEVLPQTDAPAVPRHFKVDVLLARRYICYDSVVGPRKKQYLVRWVGHGPEADVWYDVESLVHCEELVAKYDREHPEPDNAALVPLPNSQTTEENLHLAHLHSRAADRMITFQPQTAVHEAVRREQSGNTDRPARSNILQDVAPAADVPHDSTQESVNRNRPKPIWAGESQAERVKPLRHQKSWHGPSKAGRSQEDPDSFDFSPMAVMKKYPPVALVDPTAVRSGDRLGHRNTFPITESTYKPVKAVSFAARPEATRMTFEDGPAVETINPSRVPPTDPTLYSPPSPVIPALKRQSSMSYRETAHPANDIPEPSLRRAKSLNLRSAAPQASEERTRDRRDRFRPYADPRVRTTERASTNVADNGMSHFSVHASRETASLRRANTTAGIQSAARHTDGVRPRGRPPRDEGDTRRDNIAHCRFRLSEMGFPRDEASVVAEAVSGDLESALDILNEDGRARDELERYTKRSRYGYASRERAQMPGAFPWK